MDRTRSALVAAFAFVVLGLALPALVLARSRNVVLRTRTAPLAEGAEVAWSNASEFQIQTSAGDIGCAPGGVNLHGVIEDSPGGALTSAQFVECQATVGLGPVQLAATHLPWDFVFEQGWTPKGPPSEGTVPILARGNPAFTATFPEAHAACLYVSKRRMVKESSLAFRLGQREDPEPVRPITREVAFKLKRGPASSACPKEAELARGIRFAVTSQGEAIEAEFLAI